MLPKKKLQVFVSSTYKDLIVERQIAIEAILQAGHIPAGMELFAAGDEEQWEVIKKWIQESDVFLLILGGRYGTIELKSKKSYIHLEYEFAQKIGVPFCSVIANDCYLKKKAKKLDDPRDVFENENQKEFLAFLESVKSKMCDFWDNTDQLSLTIFKALSKFNNREDLIGWVRGSFAIDGGLLAEEIARLTKENSELRDKLNKTIAEDFGGLDFTDLVDNLELHKIDFANYKKIAVNEKQLILDTAELFTPDGEERREVNLLHVFWANAKRWNGLNPLNTDMNDFYNDICFFLERYELIESKPHPNNPFYRGSISITKKGKLFLNMLMIELGWEHDEKDNALLKKYFQKDRGELGIWVS